MNLTLKEIQPTQGPAKTKYWTHPLSHAKYYQATTVPLPNLHPL